MEEFFATEAGQTVVAALGAVIALGARSAVRWIDAKIKRTPTRIDDKVRAAVRAELADKREAN